MDNTKLLTDKKYLIVGLFCALFLFSFTNISAIPQYNKLDYEIATSTSGGNSSWNETRANSLYAELNGYNTFSSYNYFHNLASNPWSIVLFQGKIQLWEYDFDFELWEDRGYLFKNGNVNVPYNVTASKFIGDGSLLTGITGGNSSWNETRANSLYYSNTNPSGYYNVTTLPSSSFNNTNIAYINNSQVFAGLNNFSQRVFINPTAAANYNASLIIGRASPITAGNVIGKGLTIYASSTNENASTPFKAGFISEYDNTQNTGYTYADTTTGAWFRLKNLGTGNQSTMRGVMTQTEYAGTGSIGNVIGGYFASQKTGSGSVTGALIGGSFYVSNSGGTGVSNARLLNLEMPYADATNFITNLYAVYINPLNRTGTTNTWGIYQASNIERNYFAGWTGYGTATKVNTEIASFVGNTSITGLMKLNTITLPTCSATYKNMIGANATATYGCNSTAWVRLF